MRFIWSAVLDHLPYRLVYGELLTLQFLLAATMSVAINSKVTYGIWICLALFCEGGHFTIVPNTLKKIFGDQATSLYGIMLTYTGFSSMLLIGMMKTPLGEDYIVFYLITAGCSLVALGLLVFAFDETRFTYDATKLREAVKGKIKKKSETELKADRESNQV